MTPEQPMTKTLPTIGPKTSSPKMRVALQTKPPQTVQKTKAEQPATRSLTMPPLSQRIEQHSKEQTKTAPHSKRQATNSLAKLSQKTKTSRPQKTALAEPPMNAELQQPKTELPEQKPTISPPRMAEEPQTTPPSKRCLQAEHPETVRRQKEIHTS
jgi:hypothetical protein